MILIDAHQDLAYNILMFHRDYTRSVAETRRLEAGTATIERNEDTLLGWPEYQAGKVAVIFSTLFVPPVRRRAGEWEWMSYRDIAEANKYYRQQVDVYHSLANDHPEHFKLILTRSDLDEIVGLWSEPYRLEPQETNNKEQQPAGKPVGLVILMEGAEGVRHPEELSVWWELGVRWIGPAWAGTRFCGGTREPGPMTKEGFELLEGMADLGFGLDISHMDEAAALQALDRYPGPIIASHSNVWSLLRSDSNRHLSDRVLHSLIERDGMTGIVPYNAFLKRDWRRNDHREEVTLHHLVAQIDAVCQAAGSSSHVGLGSDFDGGFGVQSVPVEIDSIADLRKLIPLLAEKGYQSEDIARILAGNWLDRLHRVLPGK
jgi:membrane dipeptidase